MILGYMMGKLEELIILMIVILKKIMHSIYRLKEKIHKVELQKDLK
jgi:hypothetical protein